jgi:hypothetical protein
MQNCNERPLILGFLLWQQLCHAISCRQRAALVQSRRRACARRTQVALSRHDKAATCTCVTAGHSVLLALQVECPIWHSSTQSKCMNDRVRPSSTHPEYCPVTAKRPTKTARESPMNNKPSEESNPKHGEQDRHKHSCTKKAGNTTKVSSRLASRAIHLKRRGL